MPSINALRVLVVDDDTATRDLLAEVLQALGACVRMAGSASDARRALAAERPDVIVSDVSMPDEDGCELMRGIRRLPAVDGGRVPAIAFTAAQDNDTLVRALHCGFTAVLHKPLDVEALVAAIAQVADTADRLPLETEGPVARDS
ncbi:MAG TPA: response regulator [Casimicrobiaceae bacterium]|nr:response regulator [Casimicrobiaceae bacterium]